MDLPPDPDLSGLLKQNFGFSAFRPLQEEIIRASLDGSDVFALLPTGGGKSLCFQLRALARPGLVLVVSPLIALMKDQVDSLQASGIPATFLNSSLTSVESKTRLRGLHQGQYKLLYAAPERLMLSGFLSDLQSWNLQLLAIDEAHCISEWGHDFRPEYRQLAQLRQLFPQVPMMAVTATATHRVRQDILTQLHLRDPACFVASFDRPNLLYSVISKQNGFAEILRFLQERPRESGIVYCQSRKSAESLADKLTAAGIRSRPYHAGMTPDERTQSQELFLRDRIRVVCATIAFGMGINKPNVRFVIHYDLPKNLEGYYQETGRAGRDGLPGECVLFFSAGDVVKHSRFIDEKPDPKERQLAIDHLQQVVRYAESPACRRASLLRYFGETYGTDNCGACDNCLAPRDTYDGTVAAQKFLSCVFRLRQRSGFDFGMNQVAAVLTGARAESIRKWGHDQVSTFGIGSEHTREEWKIIGRELVRLGFLEQGEGTFSGVKLTQVGTNHLKQRRAVTLTKAVQHTRAGSHRFGEIACDEPLFERLRLLRERLATERNVHTHVLLSDVTLRLIAREYPTTRAALGQVSGMVEKKLAEFGELLLAEVNAHLAENPRQLFAQNSFQAHPAIGYSSNTRPEKSRRRETEDTAEYDRGLFDKLREVRSRLAAEQGLPAYMILHDSVLREMARSFPADLGELSAIRQVGPNRAAKFGSDFLEVITAHPRRA